MTRTTTTALTIAMAQYPQLPMGTPFDVFADSVRGIVARTSPAGSHPELVCFPEMHLFGTPGGDASHGREAEKTDMEALEAAAVDFRRPEGNSDDLVRRLSSLAHELGIWLIPGTVPEHNPRGGIFNTAPVFAPDGRIAGTYRKICPWRPYEKYTPGDSFTVVDIPGRGRIGLTICYDAWFPEITRQVAWLGADLIVNLVRTTTPDRRQELVLARANAIANQVFLASVNAAGPDAVGDSLLIDPEGNLIDRLDGPRRLLGIDTILLGQVRRVHETGTAGLNKVWEQFRDGDPAIALPAYAGSLDAGRWRRGGER